MNIKMNKLMKGWIKEWMNEYSTMKPIKLDCSGMIKVINMLISALYNLKRVHRVYTHNIH